MSKITFSSVWRHATAMGLRVDELGKGSDDDPRFWLTVTNNWQTTEPGRTLAEIEAELNERDGGEWQRKQQELEQR